MLYFMMAYRMSGNFADKITGLVCYSHIKTHSKSSSLHLRHSWHTQRLFPHVGSVIGVHEERGGWDKWDRNWTIWNAFLQPRVISNRDKYAWNHDSKLIGSMGEERSGEEELTIQSPVSAENKKRTRWYIHALAKSKPAIPVSEQSKIYVLRHSS
jgi:hypothetical protein